MGYWVGRGGNLLWVVVWGAVVIFMGYFVVSGGKL